MKCMGLNVFYVSTMLGLFSSVLFILNQFRLLSDSLFQNSALLSVPVLAAAPGASADSQPFFATIKIYSFGKSPALLTPIGAREPPALESYGERYERLCVHRGVEHAADKFCAKFRPIYGALRKAWLVALLSILGFFCHMLVYWLGFIFVDYRHHKKTASVFFGIFSLWMYIVAQRISCTALSSLQVADLLYTSDGTMFTSSVNISAAVSQKFRKRCATAIFISLLLLPELIADFVRQRSDNFNAVCAEEDLARLRKGIA